MPPLLEARDLSKHYGQTIALESVSFEVHEGVTGLLGPNGAGKSTVIKLFLGLIRPTSGSAEVMGKRPYDSVEGRARLGYMPETEALPSNMNASEFLMHMAQVSGLPPSHARTRAADILRHVGLDEERYRAIGEYSTGMKQRVKLAQTLVHDPVLVLLDEPTAGLDPGGREEMLGLIRRTAHTFGISMLLSTHLMGDIERVADRVILLEGGHVAEQGDLAQFTKETADLIIEVEDRGDEVLAALGERGLDVVREGSLIVARDVTDAGYDTIRDVVADSGARLRRLTPRRHTLTEIFQGERPGGERS
ncbi:MAG: ABC transporter ATP-binding protein [Chloroflexi bacterium]|nr:ABC transporter ATP-binding protein [Chloroflexota bacterium]